MKTIIITAGIGSRLNPLTNDKPKCMLEFKGKTLLRHQVDALRESGIDRVVVIKEYKKEVINYPDLIYYILYSAKKNIPQTRKPCIHKNIVR